MFEWRFELRFWCSESHRTHPYLSGVDSIDKCVSFARNPTLSLEFFIYQINVTNDVEITTGTMSVLYFPDSKVYGTNMGPTWVLSAPDGPHVGPMNLVIKVPAFRVAKTADVAPARPRRESVRSMYHRPWFKGFSIWVIGWCWMVNGSFVCV